MSLPISPSQTIGPFSHEAWNWAVAITGDLAAGPDYLTISGTMRDGAGAPVNDAMIEAWLPQAAGAEQGHALPGFRRVPTDDSGAFTLRVPRPAPGQPAALVTVFARGLVLHQFTAVFLEDGAPGDSAILAQVPAERRATLIAGLISTPGGEHAYAWDIAMQGPQETVFFDYAGPA